MLHPDLDNVQIPDYAAATPNQAVSGLQAWEEPMARPPWPGTPLDAPSAVRTLALGSANAYLVPCPGGLSLVDTGTAPSAARLHRLLARGGLRPTDLDRVILTHAHYDHAGGARALRDLGVPIWAHELEVPHVQGTPPLRPDPQALTAGARLAGWLLRGPMPPTQVDRPLHSGEVLPELGPEVQVLHLPGHSPGHLGLWFPHGRLLIGGDVVTHFLPWRLTAPVSAYTPDPPTARRSIQAVADLGPEALAMGHGRPITRGAGLAVRALLRTLPT